MSLRSVPAPAPGSRVVELLAAVVLALLAAGCNRTANTPQILRLTPAGDVSVELYTLAAETRPALGAPAEAMVRVRTDVRTETSLALGLPDGFPADTPAVVSGTLRKDDETATVSPFVVRPLSINGHHGFAMERQTLLAAMPEATDAELTMTALRADDRQPIQTEELEIPADASMEFAVGLAPAAAIDRNRKVRLSVSARVGGANPTELWNTVLAADDPASYAWHEASLDLTPLAGKRVRLELGAANVEADRPPCFALWQRPEIVVGASQFARPSIILISLDTLRADRIGVYGSYRPTTPSLDRRAADAAVFTNAWSTWPETSGAHMSMFTSRYPSEHGVRGFIYRPRPGIRLLAEALQDAGYATRAFTEDGGVWARAGFARGFDAYSERRAADFVYHGEAAATFEDAADWLARAHDRDFFLFIHTYEVHAPYEPSGGYAGMFTQIAPREPAPFAQAALDYDRETRFLDDVVERFFRRLDELELADRVVVLVTSDHGEEFGEHGGLGHGRSIYQEVLHVPLMVWAPGRLAPGRFDAPASILDVAPTVLELAGLPPDPDHRGASLLSDAGRSRERVLFAELDREDGGPRRAVGVRWKGRSAIRDLTTDGVRCYDADDFGQQHPGEACPELEDLLAEHLASQQTAAENKLDVSPEVERKMRALGYLD